MSLNRIEKVNSLLSQEIGKIILRDFDFSDCLVTLTYVDTTPNLIDTKVYISVMPENKIENIVKILNNGVYDIQHKINRKLNMRPIPKILFVKDDNIRGAARIEAILNQIDNSQSWNYKK